MEKTKKRAKIWLCIAIALMLISMIGASLVQTDFGNVTIKQLSIETDAGFMMDCDLYIPDNATEENPAPAIVTSHGNYNNKEMQDANFVELARRGFVVLTIDQPNHGNSDWIASNDSSVVAVGVYQGAIMLSRLPFVDADRIGVTGHSMGGNSCNYAIQAENANGTHYIASVLLNCADAFYTGDDGNFTNIYGDRDVAVLSAVYDEFFHYVYGEGEKPIQFAPQFMETDNAQSFLNFGADPSDEGFETREADTVYYADIEGGKDVMRVIYRPDIIHPWAHFSAKATADVIDFFTESLGAPNPIDSSNQVWQWKEAFNFVGVIGMALFVVFFATLLVYTPMFSELRAKEVVAAMPAPDKKGKLWFWGSLIISAIISTVIYLPVVSLGNRSTSVLQPESFGIALWAMCCGLLTILSMFIYYRCYGKKHGFNLRERGVTMSWKKLGKTVLLGVIVAAVAYTWVFVADYFFKTDFRLWTLAIKTFEADKIGISLWPYLWLFLVFYVASSVSVNCFNYNTIGGKRGYGNVIILALFVAFPALVLPWIQYGYYLSTDIILFWGATDRLHMYTLWLFPMVIILIGATLINRAIYKVTKNPYIAGIALGIIITLMTCTNTRIFNYLG